MYASIRRYRMAAGSLDDLMHRVDVEFADRLVEELGLLGYQAVDTGDRTPRRARPDRRGVGWKSGSWSGRSRRSSVPDAVLVAAE
jgi:hypothetical protein